jgi:hypothetical protein
MLVLPPTDLPGNEHRVDKNNPVRVVGARQYRVSWMTVIERNRPDYDKLASIFEGPGRPAHSFGVAGLESQEHSVFWVGPPAVIADFEAKVAAATWLLDVRPLFDEMNRCGGYAERWPNDEAWLNLIPATTWNPGGQGIVTEYDFDGASVVVYELLGRPSLLSPGVKRDPKGPVPSLMYHCTRCHHGGDHGNRYMSAGPDDRAVICRKARQHMRPGNCDGAEAVTRGNIMVAAVQSVATKMPEPANKTGLYAASCQTKTVDPNEIMALSSCAEIHEARKHTDRHTRAVG